MPYRTQHTAQDWLLPPTLGELLADDHPVRFVAEFVDQLSLQACGIMAEPAREGAPRYHPKILLSAWLYGFMVRIRSSRQLERACAENIPLLWLTGLQQPDHVTLWRFYDANRAAMRALLRATVVVAQEVGLVDFVLAAVDGCRVSIGSGDGLCDRADLLRLLAQVAREIAAMEEANQQAAATTTPVPHGPHALWGQQERRARIQQALTVLARRAARTAGRAGPAAGSAAPAAPGAAQPVAAAQPPAAAGRRGRAARKRRPPRALISPSDPEAVQIKGRHGFSVGYNGQLVVDSQAQIIVAAEVVACSADQGQLAPMLQAAHALSGHYPQQVVADAGYFAGADIIASQAWGSEPFVPDERQAGTAGPSKNPYHKQHFVYDPASDRFRCPLGQVLTFDGLLRSRGRTYRMDEGRACRGCAAQADGSCTQAQARRISVSGDEAALAAHHAKMQRADSRRLLRRRAGIVEPVFAVLREQLGLVRFLVRGLRKVQAAWCLLCAAHNLRKLWKLWWQPQVRARWAG